MPQSLQPTQNNAPVAPASTSTTTGFQVSSGVGGAGDYGLVSWQPTGHAVLTAAGLDALLSQAATYTNGLSLRNVEQISVHGPAGSYSCQNADLVAQQAAVVAILATAANVSGKVS